MKKILVTAYLAQNLGDDLFLHILFKRYANIEWGLVVNNIEYKKIFENYKNVKVIYNNKIIRGIKKIDFVENFLEDILIEKYDALVEIGGSIFIEKQGWEELYLKRKRIIEKIKIKNKKVFIIGCNFGNYQTKKFKVIYEELFKVCDDVCFRDQYSYNLFNGLDNIRLGKDIVLGLDNKKSINSKNKKIGISIIDIENREFLSEFEIVYIKKYVEIINYFIKKEYEVTLFSFCESEGDLNAINKLILKSEKKEFLKLVKYSNDIISFIEEFSKMDYIISNRFHSMILSQVFNQGVYPIVYNEKTLNSLIDLGIGENFTWIKDIENLDINLVEKTMVKNKIKNKENILEDALNHFKKLDVFLEYEKKQGGKFGN